MPAPTPNVITLSATGQYQLTTAGAGAGPAGWLLVFQGTGWTGSGVLKSNQTPPGSANNLVSVAWTNMSGVIQTAGTAISTSIGSIVEVTGYDLWIDYTHTAGSVTITILPCQDIRQTGGITVPAGDISAGTFGEFLGPDTGPFAFPTTLQVGTTLGLGAAPTAAIGLRMAASVTAASSLAQGIRNAPTLIAAANSDVLVGQRTVMAFTPGAFTGLQAIGHDIAAFSVAAFTSPADPYGINVGVITGTGATNAVALRLAPPTGASNNYLIAHTTAATFNVTGAGAMTLASTINGQTISSAAAFTGTVSFVTSLTSAAGKIGLGTTPGTTGAINVDASSYSGIGARYVSSADVITATLATSGAPKTTWEDGTRTAFFGFSADDAMAFGASSAHIITIWAQGQAKWEVGGAAGASYLYSQQATMSIIGGATANRIRNNADNASNLAWTDAGVFTFRSEVVTAASTTSLAGLNIPHGSAPTSPVDGDMWTTTAGAFIRINGVTKTFTLT